MTKKNSKKRFLVLSFAHISHIWYQKVSKSFKKCSQFGRLGRLETTIRYEVNCGNLASVTTTQNFHSLTNLCQAFHADVNFIWKSFKPCSQLGPHIPFYASWDWWDALYESKLYTDSNIKWPFSSGWSAFFQWSWYQFYVYFSCFKSGPLAGRGSSAYPFNVVAALSQVMAKETIHCRWPLIRISRVLYIYVTMFK